MRSDKKHKELYETLALRHGISPKVVAKCIEHIDTKLAETFLDPSCPTIMLHNFGTFKVKPGRIKYFRTKFQQYLDEGRWDQERFEKFSSKLDLIELKWQKK